MPPRGGGAHLGSTLGGPIEVTGKKNRVRF